MSGGGVIKMRLAAAAALLLALLAVPPVRAADTLPIEMPITTGGVTGIYYQIGAAICRLLRDHPPAVPIDCQTQGSAGSIANVLAVAEGRMPLGLAQGDTLYYAVTGSGGFGGSSPDTKLRSLFSPVVETFLVLTTADNWAAQVADLRGRRINIGAPASGTEVTFRQMMAARGWSAADFRDLSGIRASLQAQALCAGRVDAVVFVAANPVPVIQDAAFACAARFVPLNQAFASDMIARHPYYVPVVVPGGLYPNNPDPTPTIGVRGIVIASTATPDEIAYLVTRTVFEHLPEMRTLHLAFADVTAEEMLGPCLFAPVHPGAARYYREAGLPQPKTCLPP
jgi:TRAP transporter TAXI family solute receptor